MRVAATIALLASTGWAQFRSTVPLVVAPTTVTDSKGRYVDGLTPADLILYDNNVPQTIRMDWMTYPIDLVVAVQTSSNSGAVIDKLGGSGILFTQLLAADAGQTAVISFSDEVTVHSVVVTHDLDLIYKVADRVVFLYDGGVIYCGPVSELEKSEHPHIREFLELDRVERV